MPIFTILGLILSVIKIGIDLAAYLKDHPETTKDAKTMYAAMQARLAEMHGDASEMRDQLERERARTEAP